MVEFYRKSSFVGPTLQVCFTAWSASWWTWFAVDSRWERTDRWRCANDRQLYSLDVTSQLDGRKMIFSVLFQEGLHNDQVNGETPGGAENSSQWELHFHAADLECGYFFKFWLFWDVPLWCSIKKPSYVCHHVTGFPHSRVCDKTDQDEFYFVRLLKRKLISRGEKFNCELVVGNETATEFLIWDTFHPCHQWRSFTWLCEKSIHLRKRHHWTVCVQPPGKFWEDNLNSCKLVPDGRTLICLEALPLIQERWVWGFRALCDIIQAWFSYIAEKWGKPK